MSYQFKPFSGWKAVHTIEAHACGEPLRVIISGLPDIPGRTILEKRCWAENNLNELRKGLMWEPRGHADMYGAIITEPVSPDGDIGVLFIHNEGFSTMCGHGIIGLTKVLLDAGIILKDGDVPQLNIDTPAGRVTARAIRNGREVHSVTFQNVPSFLFSEGQRIDIEGIGCFEYSIAYGGAFYIFCSSDELGLELTPSHSIRLIETGRKIKNVIMEKVIVKHPRDNDLGFLYGTIFVGQAVESMNHSRNVCIFADGELDRSPTGTGVSARAAIHYSRGELNPGEEIKIESILGTVMSVKIIEVTRLDAYDAVIPEISGTAYITGESYFYFDPSDPLKNGFLLR